MYFVFDIETIADGDLISQVKYPGENLNARDAVARFNKELADATLLTGKKPDIIPPTFVLPISVVIAKVTDDFELADIVALDEPRYDPETIAKLFWQGWVAYKQPTLVSFNGRGYDLPVLEMTAYRYAVSVPGWFNQFAKSWEQSRNRYNLISHFDVADFMGNYGGSRPAGGLNLLSKLLGKPGKMGVDGSQVQDLYDQGKLKEINDYCRCDVLDTYFVFLRSQVLMGRITLDREKQLTRLAFEKLLEWHSTMPVYAEYLRACRT